jgi:hypothetical protein
MIRLDRKLRFDLSADVTLSWNSFLIRFYFYIDQLNFGPATLRRLLTTFDLDRSGHLGVNEFVCLYQFVLSLRNSFASQDRDRSGKLDNCTPDPMMNELSIRILVFLIMHARIRTTTAHAHAHAHARPHTHTHDRTRTRRERNHCGAGPGWLPAEPAGHQQRADPLRSQPGRTHARGLHRGCPLPCQPQVPLRSSISPPPLCVSLCKCVCDGDCVVRVSRVC